MKLKLILHIIAALLSSFFLTRPIFDPDLPWHLIGGAKILEQLSANFSIANLVPQTDFINSFQEYWHDYHWLGQIILYKIYESFDYLGLQLFFLIVIFLLYVNIVDILHTKIKLTNKFQLCLLLLFPTAYLINDVSSVRPQILAVLVLSYVIKQLFNKPSKADLPICFLAAIVLVNIHVYWVFVPFIWLCYRCLPTLISKDTKHSRTAWYGLIPLVLAGLVSPYGILRYSITDPQIVSNYALILEYMFTPDFLKGYITEFLSPLRTFGINAILLLGFLVVLARSNIWQLKSEKFGIHLAGAITLFLACSSVKFSAIFVLLALPSIVTIVNQSENQTALETKLNHSAVSLLLLVIAVFSVYKFFTAPLLNQSFDEQIQTYRPLAACKKIASLKANPTVHKHIRVATDFNNGGWCRWILWQADKKTDYQVTTDGRTQWVKPDHFRDGMNLYRVKEGWIKTLEKWQPDFILVARENALGHVLPFMTQEWRNVYAGQNFSVYYRK